MASQDNNDNDNNDSSSNNNNDNNDNNRSLPSCSSPSNENSNHLALTLLDQGSPEDAKLSFEPDPDDETDDLNGAAAAASASSIASATAAYDPFAPETVMYHPKSSHALAPSGLSSSHHHTSTAAAASVSESSPRATPLGPDSFPAAASVGAYSYHPLPPPPLHAGERGLLLHEAGTVSAAAAPNDMYDYDAAGVPVAMAVPASNKPPPPPPPQQQQHVAYGAWPGAPAPVRYMMPASQQQQQQQQQHPHPQQYGRIPMPMHLQHPHAHAPVIYHGSMHHLPTAHNDHVMMTSMYDPALMRPAGAAAAAAPPPSARYYYHPDHDDDD